MILLIIGFNTGSFDYYVVHKRRLLEQTGAGRCIVLQRRQMRQSRVVQKGGNIPCRNELPLP